MKIIPSRYQWSKWSLPSKVTYISFIITVLALFVTILSPILFSNSKFNLDTKNGNITIIEGNQNVFNSKVENTEKLNKDTLEYSIKGTKNQALISLIEKKINIKIVSFSKNKINISHNGTLELLNENNNSYIYSGGNIFVSVNNNCNCVFKNYKIPPMRASPKNVILNEIERVVNFYIDKNLSEVSNKIIACIKK
jgi:hypothetical protein